MTKRRKSTGADIRLVGADTTVAGRVEIHTVITENGVMRMRPLAGGLPIGAGETAELRRGSHHIMLIDLRRALRRGEAIPITLRFDGAASVTANFTVRSAADAPHGGGHE